MKGHGFPKLKQGKGSNILSVTSFLKEAKKTEVINRSLRNVLSFLVGDKLKECV
jgi:hypothetical protein